jgi:predicted HicB family RNase H-like nuclease
METKTDYQRFNLRLPIDLHRRIKVQAEADRRSITQTIILAIEMWLERRKKDDI